MLTIVTGATHGIGYETAKALGVAGYHTILACRNKELGEQIVAELVKQTGIDRFELMILDLSSLSSVNKFVDEFYGKGLPLHILVNNAGVSENALRATQDGIEVNFGVNFLGHFLLTTRLIPALKQASFARIINLTSVSCYRVSRIDERVISGDHGKEQRLFYHHSKLAIVVFSNTLARILADYNITSNSVHPGWVRSNITSQSPHRNYVNKILVSSCKSGAIESIRMALSHRQHRASGKLFAFGIPLYMHPVADDPKMQQSLWKISEQLVAKHTTYHSSIIQ